MKTTLAILIGLVLGALSVYFFMNQEPEATPAPLTPAPEEELSFTYPENFNTTYIHTVDWPPQMQIIEEPYECLEAGDETARAGETRERTIDGNKYCVTIVAEGAAGSIYRQYAYAFPHNDETVILTFSLRYPQCGNYPDAERTACEVEQSGFDLDTKIHEIVSN